ncbi:DUF4336 domain-containing protein [Photobacterium rosenbergii]|uniref:DUF4336 domain-containing protein n=1 Tax=Photobacterium rosenbergii TaxID=294936 RepID=A0ABU3ZEW4_9GAMM|nr:DUF4336 domain-containing protein [Photobacterium rosenbergii]MDV5168649.1 DUF4336 domain-containing protein [Photobacterium rosenbergii]
MRKISDDIWILDGEAVPFLSLPFTTRMTVVRLPEDQLWVHSPIKLTSEIKSQLADLGEVKYLIAPNHLHHLFIADWQSCYPDAMTIGTREVIKKRADIIFSSSLNDDQKWPWADEIDQVMFTGSPLMEECVFFHIKSGTLIVTDLIENFPSSNFNHWQRLIAKGVGILAPNGKMPLDWRLSFTFGKSQAREHLNQIITWHPKVIVMSHGEIVESGAKQFIETSFRWLLFP